MVSASLLGSGVSSHDLCLSLILMDWYTVNTAPVCIRISV